MTDKDPKDMTASELLRWATNGEPYNGVDGNSWTYPTEKIKALVEDVTGKWPSDHEAFSIIADKIDAELAQATAYGISEGFNSSLRAGAELWAKANGWPDFREVEDFGAWLDRCAIKLPCDKDGEPWNIGDRVIPGNRCESTVTGFAFDGDGWFLKYRWCGIDSYANEFATSCKRPAPAPEVLGADLLPIKVGETVWLDEAHSRCAGSYGFEDGNKYSLCGIERQEMLTVEDAHIEVDGREYVRVCTCGAWCHASWLTHTPPETQERIDDDATLSPREYYNAHIGHDVGLKDDEEVAVAMVHDLLRRQRELDKRTGGE